MNVVNIMGNVGQDPEIKKTETLTIATLSIATKGYKDKTEWHRCKAFGKTAEIIEQFVNKGDLVGITGEIQYSEYEGKYYTDIIINRFFFGSKKNSGGTVEQSTTTDEAVGKEPESDDLPF